MRLHLTDNDSAQQQRIAAEQVHSLALLICRTQQRSTPLRSHVHKPDRRELSMSKISEGGCMSWCPYLDG